MKDIKQRIERYAEAHKAELRLTGFILAFWFVWSQAPHINDLFNGLFEGYHGSQEAHH